MYLQHLQFAPETAKKNATGLIFCKLLQNLQQVAIFCNQLQIFTVGYNMAKQPAIIISNVFMYLLTYYVGKLKKKHVRMLLQLDCFSWRRTRIINLVSSQKGYDTFETTVGKLSTRRIQIGAALSFLKSFFSEK